MFQLDPDSLVARATAEGGAPRVPTLGESMTRGMLGFMVVAAIGFAPWAIFELWFRGMRETQLYIACTVAFNAASGPLLHQLIIGPGSLVRFYPLFALAFISYACAWIACWVTLRGSAGEFFGLLAGSVAMGAVVAFGFRAMRALPIAVVALFLGNLAGYYLGDWIYHTYSHTYRYPAMIAWGVLYGLGFGAGLAVAFYAGQNEARDRLRGK